jgi:hypothetical protein
MERTIETPVKEQIRNALNGRGVYFRMPPANGYGKAGDFDFVCCVRGQFLGIEAKRDDKEEPTTLQHDNADKARLAGAVVLLIHKGNVGLVTQTVDALHARIKPPSYWPERRLLVPEDITPPLLRRKRRDNL